MASNSQIQLSEEGGGDMFLALYISEKGRMKTNIV